MLGIGLTALVASFMSGMAGNVTAFNTVWTYDIYQSYIKKDAPDSHYLWMGRMATIFGTLISIGAAYLARSFNNMMDFLQLIFGFVNAPLFATFLLGMFWKRTTANGAFFGLLSGTSAAALTYGMTVAEGKGGYLGVMHTFPSSMAQNFWVAINAFMVCLLVTVVISLLGKARPDSELVGLVYGVTKHDVEPAVWYKRPAVVASIAIVVCVVLNLIYF
jgi:SSS family solute:Na+ symporter